MFYPLKNPDQICNELYAQGYCVIESFLSIEDFQSLKMSAQMMLANAQFRSAKIGRQFASMENANIRTDKIAWLDEVEQNTAMDNYLSKINQLAQGLNQAFFLGLDHLEAHFAIYPPGSFYRKHVDQFKGTQDRRISCVYYLNDQWQEQDGGQLKLYNESNELLLNLLPTANRLIVFKSDLAHEVCETHRSRFSITGWLKVRSLSLSA